MVKNYPPSFKLQVCMTRMLMVLINLILHLGKRVSHYCVFFVFLERNSFAESDISLIYEYYTTLCREIVYGSRCTRESLSIERMTILIPALHFMYLMFSCEMRILGISYAAEILRASQNDESFLS